MTKFYAVNTDNLHGDAVYVSTTEVAKYVRALLKAHFPGVKFSVRSDKYSGGSSISVEFSATPGVNASDVKALIDHLHGGGFDGSIDMSYYRDHYILSSGEIVYAGTDGTASSGGYVPSVELEMPEGARRASLSNTYMFLREDGRTR